MANNLTLKDLPEDIKDLLDKADHLCDQGKTSLDLRRGQGRGFKKPVAFEAFRRALPQIISDIETHGPAFLLRPE